MSVNSISAVSAPKPLKILHCLRAPVGGLFRHVIDVATAQAAAGHSVGVVCAATGDALTETRLRAFAPALRLGLHRLPMSRDIGLGDFRAWRQVVTLARNLEVDVLHGHGAKGGAYARLAARGLKKARGGLKCYYTPHGGSLHYGSNTLAGQIYGRLERQLELWTDGIIFESRYAANRYANQIGTPKCATTIIHNGLSAGEFDPVATAPDAADFVFVGELRTLKGVDVALDALAIVNRSRPVTAIFAGAGPDSEAFKAQAQALGIDARVTFAGPMRAREAFAKGRVLLMPSRAESLPYIILEAIAAGLPVLATNVGGIPEIIAEPFGPLLPPGDAGALAAAMDDALARPDLARMKAEGLHESIREAFTIEVMSAAITDFYDAARASRLAA